MYSLQNWVKISVFCTVLFGATGVHAQECQTTPLESAINRGKKLVTLLKVATFRADVTYMGEVATELKGFLATCGNQPTGRLVAVCDYDCHLQLARYHLFMASDFPFLATGTVLERNTQTLAPDQLTLHAEEGLAILDRGTRLLAQQSGGGTGAAAEASFREQVRQLTLLNALKVRLLMVTGDVWYQTVSEARLKRLGYIMADATGGSTGVPSDGNLSRAQAYYENAQWVMIEALTDIPDGITYEEYRTGLLSLQNDLKLRLDSISHGHLYLGIDPERFTSINFEDLKRFMDELKTRLNGIESQVQTIVERWHKDKNGEDTRSIDEGRLVRSQEANLIAHRIAIMEESAKTQSDQIRLSLNAVEGDRDSAQYRQRIRQLEIELERRLAEYNQRKQFLQEKRAADILLYNRDVEAERRNELRWLLGWEISKMNLELQISSLEAQVEEYNRQKSRNDNQLAQLVYEKAAKQKTIENSQIAIADAESQLVALGRRETDLYQLKRSVRVNEICRIEQDLAFVGTPIATPYLPQPGESVCPTVAAGITRVELQKQMCGDGSSPGLRQRLTQANIDVRAFLLACVLGRPTPGTSVDCSAFPRDELAFAKAIHDGEDARYEERRTQLTAFKAMLQDHIANANAILDGWVAGAIITDFAIKSLEGTLVGLVAVPRTSVCACALASGITTYIEPSNSVATAINIMKDALNRSLQFKQLETQKQTTVDALKREIARTEDAIQSIDPEKEAHSLAFEHTVFKLNSQATSGEIELRREMLTRDVTVLECRDGASALDNRIATLRSEHSRMKLEIDLVAQDNEMLAFERASLNKQIARFRNDIAIHQLEIRNLTLREDQLHQDSDSIGTLIDSTRQRITKVNQVTAKVTTMADASQTATNVINLLRDQHQKSMLGLTDQEMGYLESRIRGERSGTDELVAALNESVQLGLKSNDLNARILSFQNDTNRDVAKEQADLLKILSKIDDPLQRRNLFVATEENLSEMLQGIPEFLSMKKRTLTVANQTLQLMRKRYSLVQGLTGQEAGPVPVTYVKTGADLTQMVTDIESARFFNEGQIPVDVAEITIPATSAFLRQLASENHATFTISPAAITPQVMADKGHYVLWQDSKLGRYRNLTLVDILVGVQYACPEFQRNRLTIRHAGHGIIFKPFSAGNPTVYPDLVFNGERSFVRPIYDLRAADEVEHVMNYWNGAFSVRRFPAAPGPPNDTDAILPYLGAPVIGTYEMSLSPHTCGLEGAVMTLYLIFSGTN